MPRCHTIVTFRAEMEAKKKEKVRRHSPLTCGKRGGDDGIRTHDPHVANVMLSQLSYIPT